MADSLALTIRSTRERIRNEWSPERIRPFDRLRIHSEQKPKDDKEPINTLVKAEGAGRRTPDAERRTPDAGKILAPLSFPPVLPHSTWAGVRGPRNVGLGGPTIMVEKGSPRREEANVSSDFQVNGGK